MTTKRALITGITGQDGSYLAELLLDKGYEVIGMVRRSSTTNFERIAHLQDRLILDPYTASGDLLDEASLISILRETDPDEVYNLAAQSFVQTSFKQPVLTGEITALGVTRLLDAIRIINPEIRVYQASSSELFGDSPPPQNEATPMCPRSPYAAAKLYGYWMVRNYREGHGLYAVNEEAHAATAQVFGRIFEQKVMSKQNDHRSSGVPAAAKGTGVSRTLSGGQERGQLLRAGEGVPAAAA